MIDWSPFARTARINWGRMDEMNKPIDLDAIRAALAAATPGPWEAHDYQVWMPGSLFAACPSAAEATLIAQSPTWLAELVEEVERLRDRVKGWADLSDRTYDRAEKLQAERDRLRAEVDRHNALVGEVERLRSALRRYGRHENTWICRERGCTCGLDAALSGTSGAIAGGDKEGKRDE